jgi:hypothetical protein
MWSTIGILHSQNCARRRIDYGNAVLGVFDGSEVFGHVITSVKLRKTKDDALLVQRER